jgi:hypothetical protein
MMNAFWACPLAEDSRDICVYNGRTPKLTGNNNIGGQSFHKVSLILPTCLVKFCNKYWKNLPSPHPDKIITICG